MAYSGNADIVLKDGEVLRAEASQKLWNHGPGFSWGYGGSGPAQLALALLLDATGNARLASALHQDFKWQFTAKWPTDKPWQITTDEINKWVAEQPVTETERRMVAEEKGGS